MALSVCYCIATEYGIVGPRLERDRPMPPPPYIFPLTEQGLKEAQDKLADIQERITPRKKK